jgi:hypothetical protein
MYNPLKDTVQYNTERGYNTSAGITLPWMIIVI